MPQSIDPSTGEPFATHDGMDTRAMRAAIRAAAQAWERWRRVPVGERVIPARRAAVLLRDRSGTYASLITREMGKTLREARAEVEKCAWAFEHYAEHGGAMLADEPVVTDAARSMISYRPLGVVLAVMPWNFPFWQVLRCAAPTLTAGNAMVLKHAANVTGCALAIEQLLREAGYPGGLFRTIIVDHAQLRRAIADRRVAAVTLTGSVGAGRAVAQQAGRSLKKCVLELGGSDAYVVLADADIDAAVATCVASRLINAGQSCIAAKRFVVVDPVRDEFTAKFVARMARVRHGPPADDASDIGPLARHDLRDELHDQVMGSVAAGAAVLCGGFVPDGPGAYYPATVLANVEKGMPAWDEELFGPVASIIAARNERDAIRIANATAFGLGSAVFTRDAARGERIAREELAAGSCFVNALVKSDPRLPFGGIRESGHGRELGVHGIREFVNVKTVVVGRG